MLRPLHLLRALLFAPALALAFLAPPSAAPAEASTFQCISIMVGVRDYCDSHEQAEDPEFQLICQSHALIAFCNCMGEQCVEEDN
jgi:hypothetical protein